MANATCDSRRLLDHSGSPEKAGQRAVDLVRRIADVRPGTVLGREWTGRMQRVAVRADGFAWNGKTYPSLTYHFSGDSPFIARRCRAAPLNR
jgi:Protein of unknown function (DUF2924)